MDRQKTIPPLSTKITRKLAQESADHNTLMNFYSQISRDESGAPKKWKMSTTLHIDEESIKSKKPGTGKGSRSGTPTSSRENSNERRSLINSSLQKSQKSGRKGRDDSSSEPNSSRESSLENKSDDKKIKKSEQNKKFRHSSGESYKPRYSETIGKPASIGKKKRGPRPRSLDLSTKTMANGDDDHFKSPDPLTPCNIAVKRKKGRPKETPPVLYAEPPVELSPVDSSVDSDGGNRPLKRKPGRPKKVKVFDRNKLKSIVKPEKLKSFNMKRFEGKGLKQYGSKIAKRNLQKGFRKMAKVSAQKQVRPVSDNKQSEMSMDSFENEGIDFEMEEKNSMQENGICSEKRGRGRPPGAKNKKYLGPMTTFVTRAKTVTQINKTKFGSKNGKLRKRPGRPPGARNKSTIMKLAASAESVSNISKENDIAGSSKEDDVVSENKNLEKVNKDNIESELAKNEDGFENKLTELKSGADVSLPVNAIDEAIESVVYKARNDISLESNIKPRVPFRSSMFYKKLSSVKSVAKFKKEKDALQKIRKKRILKAHATDIQLLNQLESLPSNDLRRKLNSKLIEKMSSAVKTNEGVKQIHENEERAEFTETNSIPEEHPIKLDMPSGSENLPKEEIPQQCEDFSKNEEKVILKPESDKGNYDGDKPARKQSIDITKFSDTESICSEMSTNSFGSTKRNLDKQVLILGEDNAESDDQTVRTRQRFEIIPGKKRKRTLSGEFDLLDEKQLRKEKRKVDRGQTDDESEIKTVDIVKPIRKPLFKRRKSPLKKSPSLKANEGRIVKKYVNQIAYRNRLLRQSPFLSRVRKRRRKTLKKIESGVLSDTLKISNTDMKVHEPEDGNANEETTGLSSNGEISCTDLKLEGHRKGLFEKFTDVSLENKTDQVIKGETNEMTKTEQEIDSDETESTVELKDENFSEEQDDLPIEESVDDSITIDFHADEEKEESGKELYTESEIEIREMLFDLIDNIVLKCEVKTKPHSEFANKVLKGDTEKVYADEDKSLRKECDVNGEETLSKEKSEKQTSEEMVMVDSVSKTSKNCNELPLTKTEETPEQFSGVEIENIVNEVKEETSMVSESEKNDTVTKDSSESTDNLTQIARDKSSVAEMVENQRSLKTKMKHKVGRGRFGRKLVTENEIAFKNIKVRKKPGRKPKHFIQKEAAKTDDNAILQSKSKASPSETKLSPETGITRKFELRQKISRSPLDNIALKQSMEENVYLRNEAQKISRKEAKLKAKKLLVSDSVEAISCETDTTEAHENVSTVAIETDVETETSFETVDEMMKLCRPCKVVLKDFIKELERAQEGGSSSESELEKNDTCGGENSGKERILFEVPTGNEDTNAAIDIPISEISDNKVTEIYDNSVIPETPSSNESTKLNDESCIDTEQIINKKSENNPKESDRFEPCDSRVHTDLGEIAHAIKSNDMGENNTLVTNPKKETKQRGLRTKRTTPIKSKAFPSPKVTAKSSKVVAKGHSMNEQQTARKTVPPLKIKVKGGFSSRRKTYMVEPSPDSPVEQPNKIEHKSEKKKEKCKLKSGSKSESDSEKHNRNHHHKKRNKTPTDESTEQFKSSVHHRAETSVITSNIVSEKSAIRATDAYEATFLQFIQDKDKVEQGLATLSNSMSLKNKLFEQNGQATLRKDSKNSKKTLTSPSFAVNSESVSSEVSNDSQNGVDTSDVQYMCSQCDNVVYKAKEQIIKHYREVHPGLQFIYKPLPETTENTNTANDSQQKTCMTDNSVASSMFENKNDPASIGEENCLSQDDDDDSGSLNLKIVEVVSLKGQQNILDDEGDMSKVDQVPVVTSMQTSNIQTELRIPSYPIPSTAPPPYSNKCGPPPPYSIATGGTSIHVNSGVQDFKQQPVNSKPRNQVQSGKIGNSFKCEKCNVHAPMLAAMVAHLRNSHKEIPRLFQCPYCKDMEAETEAMIHQHIKKYHPTNNPNPPVALSEPAKRNLKTISLRLPEGMKFGDGNAVDKDIYMCLKCKEHMPSLDNIYEHLEHEHAEVFAYVCPVCKVFKSKSEDLVNNHIIMDHRRSPVDVNVSLAIDGNHFVRVQCLIKDKTKAAQKTSPSISQKPQVSPAPNAMQVGNTTLQVKGQTSPDFLQLQPITQAVVPHVPAPASNAAQTVSAVQQPIAAQHAVSKPAGLPLQKKKKSLLESIQKIKDQKGLVQQPTETSASQMIPSHPSQLNAVKGNTLLGGVPPPLMRGPPPLIRYDQLNKVTSAQSAMFGSTVRTSSQFTLQNPSVQGNLQRLQNNTVAQALQSLAAARPIQSSLFDTSDLEKLKSPQNQRPVLNVPVVSRLTNKSPFSNNPPVNSVTEGTAVVTTGSPLDLTKIPSGSPALTAQTTAPVQIASGGINPDVFQVFNLRPSTQLQLPRQQVPVQQMLAQPIVLPQQVRQNTPSTLAYRPAGPPLIATSQVQQIIGMPVGTAVIGNMVVSLGNVSQGIPSMPGVTQIQSLQNAQFVRMNSPQQMPVSAVTVMNSIKTPPTPTSAPPKAATGKQAVNKHVLFKCPYCPTLTPLRLDQVQPHIENKHPGSTILFKQFDSP